MHARHMAQLIMTVCRGGARVMASTAPVASFFSFVCVCVCVCVCLWRCATSSNNITASTGTKGLGCQATPAASIMNKFRT